MLALEVVSFRRILVVGVSLPWGWHDKNPSKNGETRFANLENYGFYGPGIGPESLLLK